MLSPHEFLFLRHGETDWNAQGLSQGSVNIPLNATGLAQAQAAAHTLRAHGIARIVSSTLDRAMQTASIVATALNLPLSTDPDLREASFGAQEGQPLSDWYATWVTGQTTPAGGEPFAHVQARIIPAINRALAAPGLPLIVAHGGMFRAVRAAMGLSPLIRAENGAALRCTPGSPWTLSPLT